MTLALAMTLAALTMGTDFRGCAPGGPPAVPADDAGLPAATGCLLDEDCVPEDVCLRYACVSGECRASGPAPEQDVDGDGFAGETCGEDCDDRDATRYPGALEACDRVDQDCDGEIDEDALGVQLNWVSDELSDTSMVALEGTALVIGRALAGMPPVQTLFAYPAGTRQSDPAPQPLDSRAAGTFASATREDGTVLLAFAPPETATLHVTELVERGGALVLELSASFETEADVEALTAARFAEQDWVLFDTNDLAAGRRRWLWRSGGTSAVEIPLAADAGRPTMANDGSSLVVATGPQTIRFLDETGAASSSLDLPGALAYQPLADGDGHVVVAYRDAFDHVLTLATPRSTTSPVAAPLGARDDQVFVFTIGAGNVIVRLNPSEARAWLLEPTLESYLLTIDPLSFSSSTVAAGRPLSAAAVTTSDGTGAIHVGYEGYSGVAFLNCGDPP